MHNDGVKRFLAFICLPVLSACGHSASAAAGGAPWLMYQGSPGHNAVVDGSVLNAHWKYDAGAQINGGLAISGKTLYVDTFNDDLVAIDVQSGKALWKAHAGNILMSTPVVSGGEVYVGSGHNGHLTHQKLPGKDTPVWGAPGGDAITAYDAASGAERWSFKTTGEDMPSAAVSDGMLVFANGDFHAYGLRSSDGSVAWRRDLPGIATMASATAVGGRVLLSECRHFDPYACETLLLDAKSGSVRWRAPFGNSDSSPAYGGGTVFVSGVESDHRHWPAIESGRGVVAALDAASGRVKWTYRTPVAGLYTAFGSAERAVAGTYESGVYYQGFPTNDMLVALDATSGKPIWRFTSTAPIKMSPVIDSGKLYVGDNSGILYELDAKSGRLIAAHAVREAFTTSPPIIVGNTILVAAGKTVYAMPKDFATHTAP